MKTNQARRRFMRSTALAGALSLSMAMGAMAADGQTYRFDIAAQPLGDALREFARASGAPIVFREELTAGRTSPAVRGDYTAEQALDAMLADAGLKVQRSPTGVYMVQDPQGGSAGGGADANAVDALIVTAQKREENIQDVPIAISAFSQEDLTTRQVAGGPDLITQIPNFSFTKTNFSSYSIQIRGIGTQAISATTDPAVAVAFNNTPFIRNRFFEQEFYDLERLEVLRGPQGTLYGRNATAGVVNIISAKPKFSYEAKASADVGNYSATRLEGMVNFPLVEDAVALRIAGAWTKRDGFATNQLTGAAIDGRDLWSTRVSLRFEPTDWLSANLIYEHFQEDDDRLRSGKQLCTKDPTPVSIGGIPVESGGGVQDNGSYLSQGCKRGSLYSPDAFQTPNGFVLPYFGAIMALGVPINDKLDPYLRSTQSRDLRVIESSVEPDYRAKDDIAELQIAIDLSDNLTLNSETSYGRDSLWSLQDYNRFTTVPRAFNPTGAGAANGVLDANGVFCDPQLGCSDRLLLVDLSTSESTQFSQEFRLGSDFDGPFNFSLGANYLRHDAMDKYYVFINSISLLSAAGIASQATPYIPGVSDSMQCVNVGYTPFSPGLVGDTGPMSDPQLQYRIPLHPCVYMDSNPIGSLNDQGRNYFLSKNPYKLISYAAFGEIYYNVTEALKITAGLRFTVDRKTAPQIPSWLLAANTSGDYATSRTVFQEWKKPTGRLAIDWKPVLSFTDETLVYGSYAHGYKAGGANPPPPVLVQYGDSASGTLLNELLPDTFDPEYVDAFEVGTKNTLFDGRVTLNLTGFYYDYKNYQVSEIRNRSAVNSNYDAEVWGAELEADWRVTDALRLGFKGGYENTRIADGEKAIDLMDRTAGTPGWLVVKSFPTVPSNCILPTYVVTAGGILNVGSAGAQFSACVKAYVDRNDPITGLPYDPSIVNYANAPKAGGGVLGPAYAGYQGFDPLAPEINGGRGFDKELGGNELPNAPNYTATVTADYTAPLRGAWTVNLHGDIHWQSESWWRVFNDHEYDRLDGFFTMNTAAIFRNEDAGWTVMAYVKNVTNETALTGAFLNSDDTGLTTNVFLTEPRLYGVRVTKDFDGGGWLGEIGRCPTTGCPVTVEFGGGVGRTVAENETYAPAFLGLYSPTFRLSQGFQDENLDQGDQRSVKVAWAPAPGWQVSGAYRFGKTKGLAKAAVYEHVAGGQQQAFDLVGCGCAIVRYVASPDNHFRAAARDSEEYDVADFAVGKDIGFGAFGDGGRSTVSLGLRYAELTSTSKVSMDGIPNRVAAPLLTFAGSEVWTMASYTTSLESERGFEGWGPSAAWDASVRLFGDDEHGHVDVDWSVGGGVLFGKQTMDSSEDRLGNFFSSHLFDFRTPTQNLYNVADFPRHREDNVTVPNLSLSLGLSYTIDRVKVSTGYSYDRFFDAVDGGYKAAESFDRTIHGPFVKLSIGFGG